MLIPQAIVQQGAGGLPLLYSNTLGADASSIDTGAAGVPQTYTHLLVVMQIRSTTAAVTGDVRIRFNNDTGGSNYGIQRGYANGATIAANEALAGGFVMVPPAASAPASWFMPIVMWVPYYRGSQKKTVLMTNAGLFLSFFSASAGTTSFIGGYWDNTTAVSQIAVAEATDNLLAGSAMSIYGF